MTNLTTIWLRVRMLLVDRARARDERGAGIVEWLGLAAMGIVAIVAIGAALQALGLDIIEFVRGQLAV